MTGRLGIDDVTPLVGQGRYPAKAVVGEHIPIGATVWREGHDALGATVTWRGPADRIARQTRMVEEGVGLDRFGASAPYEALYERFGLTADAIAPQVLARLR